MRRPVVAAGVAAVLLAAACGGSSTDEQGAATTAAAASTSIVAATTQRIIPVNGDLAEVVFALGLGDQVVATDLSATYPPEADAKPEIGYQRALQAEPILALEPTVVLADELAGPPETLDALRRADVNVVVIQRDRTVNGPPAKIRAVGAALGATAQAETLAESVATEIADATAKASSMTTHPRVLALYLRGDSVQLAMGKGSGIDAIIAAAGGVDVGTEMGIVDTRQVTAESIVTAKPDAVVVTTTGLESVGGVDGLLGVGGLALTPAGENRRILAFEDQYLYGFGPRTGQLINELSGQLATISASGATP